MSAADYVKKLHVLRAKIYYRAKDGTITERDWRKLDAATREALDNIQSEMFMTDDLWEKRSLAVQMQRCCDAALTKVV